MKRIEERIKKIDKGKNEENSDKIMEKLDSKFERVEREARRQNLILKRMVFNPANLQGFAIRDLILIYKKIGRYFE